jgi:hypothetical protein
MVRPARAKGLNPIRPYFKFERILLSSGCFAFTNEDVGGQLEPSTQVANLLYGEFPLSCKEH